MPLLRIKNSHPSCGYDCRGIAFSGWNCRLCRLGQVAQRQCGGWENGAKSDSAPGRINTIGDALGPALAEAFLKDQGAVDVRIVPGASPQEKIVEGTLPGDSSVSAITIAAHGSATAFTALADHSCDIGMASRKIKPEEAAKLTSLGDMSSVANEHILGLDGIAVIVNAANPADQLDKDKIRRIFTGEITDWSQVGSFSGAIQIYARDDKSGTYDTFKSLVLGGKPLAAGAQRIGGSKALSDAVAADSNAIGFIGLPYIQSAKPDCRLGEGNDLAASHTSHRGHRGFSSLETALSLYAHCFGKQVHPPISGVCSLKERAGCSWFERLCRTDRGAGGADRDGKRPGGV